MKISKRVAVPASIFSFGLLAAFAIANLKPKPTADLGEDKAPDLVKAQVQSAQSDSATISVTTQGTVAPKREIDLVAQVSGQVQRVETPFVDGGFFKEKELLIQIEDRDYRAAYLAAKAQLADSEQRLAEEKGRARQAKREWRDLGNGDANALFLRKPQLAAAEASVASAKAAVAQAELNLERTQIRVPFDGRIRETFVNLGQYVSPGTRIATVYDTSIAEIRLPLSDRQASLVDLPLGYSANDLKDAPKVTLFGTIGGERYEWDGRITRTDASIDVNSRMYYAVAEVENPFRPTTDIDEKFYPLVVGLFVEAEIEGKVLDNVVELRRDAVFKQNKIYVLNNEDTVEQKVVRVLHKSQDKVWIKNDLSEDTRIVVEKQALLAPGAIIEPVKVQADQTVATASPLPAEISEQTQAGE